MLEEILKGITLVYLPSMLKFIFGPIAGYVGGLNLVTTILFNVAGMMTAVIGFTFFGDWLRDKIVHKIFTNRKRFSEKNKKFVTLWRKYGLAGVAALTPVFLTPIGGTVLAVSFGAPKDKLIVYMFISASVWSVVFSTAIYLFGNAVIPGFLQPA